jgi:hypothetical protein
VGRPGDIIMHETYIVIFLLFIYNINIAYSGLLDTDKLQLNIGQLKLSFGGSKKNNDIYVLANDDDEVEESDDRPDDYKSAKASYFEKGILSKLTGAGVIDQNNAPEQGEDLTRSEVNVNKDEGSEKQTWKEISGNWKERKNLTTTHNLKDAMYSEVSCYSKSRDFVCVHNQSKRRYQHTTHGNTVTWNVPKPVCIHTRRKLRRCGHEDDCSSIFLYSFEH